MAIKRNKPSWNKKEKNIKAELKYDGKSKESGIYQITHKENKRRYVGSAKRFEERWSHHITDLRKGNHHNNFLQNDFTKSGEDKFLFEIIEIVKGSKQKRQEREQWYLDKLWTETTPNERYNHSQKAVLTEPKLPRKKAYRTDWYWFLSPNKKEYVVENLSSWCKDMKLDRTYMNKLAADKIEAYKGWKKQDDVFDTIVNVAAQTEYKASGYSITYLAGLIGVDESHLSKLLSGRRKSIENWVVKDRVIVPKEHRGKNYKLMSPEGKVVKFNNLKRFSQDNNLNATELRTLIKGNRGNKQVFSYKGWMRYGWDEELVKQKRKESYEKRFKENKSLTRNKETGKFASINTN